MDKRTGYFFQADLCKSMAAKASTVESQERWLSLAAKWLGLADETDGDRVIEDLTVASKR
jgi:hypothetical protein